MATLIVGESPCRIPKILDIMRNSANFSLFCSNWQEFAKSLAVPEKSILELNNDLKWEVINLEGLLSDLLYTWKGKCGNDAKLSVLCQALTDCHAKDMGDKLEAEFAEILKAHVLATGEVCVQGQRIKISEIFTIELHPRTSKRFRTNLDPIQILQKLVIPDPYVSTVPLAEFIQHLVDQLDEQELKVLEGCSVKWLFPQNLAEIMNAECDYDKGKAVQLVRLEKNYVLWFIAGRGVLNARLNEQQMQLILAYVFECEEDKEKKKKKKKADVTVLAGKKKYYKFKRELLVEFIDWLMGNGYELPVNFQLDWLDQYTDACLNHKNLAKHLFDMPNTRVYSLPGLLHRLVEDTISLQASELEERVNLVLNMIRGNPGSVKSLNHNLSPLLIKSVHVELIDVLIYAGASVSSVDEQGCNFVHVAAKHLPPEQFQQLVPYLVDHSLTHLLNGRDSKQETPLFYLIWYNAKPDPSTLQVVAAAGADFNATDGNGDTVLSGAVFRNRNVEILQALVMCGADFNWRCTKSNRNLLHKAAWAGNLEAVKYLVRLGLDVNSRDNDHHTPLMYAVMNAAKERYMKVVKFLLECNADVSATNKYGYAALYYAHLIKQTEVYEILWARAVR